MNRYQDWLAWALTRLGWPGWAGAVLVVGALYVLLVQVGTMEAAATRMGRQAESLAQRPQAQTQVAVARDWRADLPPDQEGYARLAKLFAVAARTRLALAEGTYREVSDSKLGLTRLSISLPVTCSYPALRAFLAQTLNQEPALALESLRMSRDTIGATELAADLRFTLYLEAGQ